MSDHGSRKFGSTAQLIAVCPLLAMSDTVVNALGIGVIVLIVVPLATALLVMLRSRLADETALAASMLILAALVACVELELGIDAAHSVTVSRLDALTPRQRS